MSKIRLHGSSSGYTEIAPVAASGNNTLTLPNDGTIISKDANGAVGVTSVVTTTATITTAKVGAAVTISESGIEASGIGITAANINGGQLGGVRNKLINGAMIVSQRGTSESSVASTKFAQAPDRWQFYCYPSSQSGTYTVSQDSEVPVGFQRSYKVDCTTADTSLQADSGVILRQTIEEQNLHDFHKGFSDAKQFSLSFYVKTTKTGTYVVELYDMRNGRHVSATYTVSDTNWNRYTITFPADTTGSFVAANAGGGMIVHWWLVAGTNYTSGSLQTTWGSTAANRAVGQLNFADSTSNNFYLTGCQLEVGAEPTVYEHRSFGEELSLCQRYYQRWKGFSDHNGLGAGRGNGSSGVFVSVNLIQCLRASPSITNAGIVVFRAGASSTSTTDTPSLTNASAFDDTSCMFPMSITGLSGITNNYGGYTVFLSSSDLQLDAEM